MASPRPVIELTIGDQTYRCIPTFKAIAEIEAAVGKSVFQIASSAAELTVKQLVVVCLAMMRTDTSKAAEVSRLRADTLGELIIGTGTGSILMSVGNFCATAFLPPADEVSDPLSAPSTIQ